MKKVRKRKIFSMDKYFYSLMISPSCKTLNYVLSFHVNSNGFIPINSLYLDPPAGIGLVIIGVARIFYGVYFFLKNVDDLFSRRPQNTG